MLMRIIFEYGQGNTTLEKVLMVYSITEDDAEACCDPSETATVLFV